MSKYKLGILGCGNMGQAFLTSLIEAKIFLPDEIIVCNRTQEKNKTLQKKFGVHTTLTPQDLETVDTIILGIKPQGLDELNFCPKKDILLISLLVGTTIQTLQKKFASAQIVRFMPNIGQYFGLGVTGVFSKNISPPDKGALKGGFDQKNNILYKKIDQIASAGAQAIWLDTEDDINHIAAISGSGPAYFFAFAEALKQSAQSLGFDEETSQNLALQTFLGAAEYIKNQTKNISSLPLPNCFQTAIATVASKGGTTQEALKKFAEKQLPLTVKQSVLSAVNRGNQLAQN